MKLMEAFPGQMIFGRSDVMQVIGIKASRASDLLKEMAEKELLSRYPDMEKVSIGSDYDTDR